MSIKRLFGMGFASAALAGGSVSAFAFDTTIDTASILTAITAAAVAVGAIGGAVASGPKVVGAAWQWVKRQIN